MAKVAVNLWELYCGNCREPKHEHLGERQCLYQPTEFKPMTEAQYRLYFPHGSV